MKDKMSQKEVKKCPMCGGEMVEGGRVAGGRFWTVTLEKKGDILGDKIILFYCKTKQE